MENTINFAKQKTSTEPSQDFMLQKLEQVNYICMRIIDQIHSIQVNSTECKKCHCQDCSMEI